MYKHPKIGVYVCRCGQNIGGVVDVEKVRGYAETLPRVVISREHKYLCSKQGQQMIAEDIKKHGLERVVVAACSPRVHEKVYGSLLEEGGLNSYLVEIANIREQCSWIHPDNPEKATEKAMDLVRGAVARTSLLEPLEKSREKVNHSVVVLGGGIAGIFAALYLADGGIKTYLVERKSSIGGHMAMLDKIFPTLDCGLCILSPKMVEVAQHKNIELIAYADVLNISGHVGNFKIKIRENPRYVDKEKCVACGVCAEKCPVKVPDTFNCGYMERKAIYIRYPQAVPNAYLINRKKCLYMTKGKPYGRDICRLCEKACDRKAINFDDEPRETEITAGAIIIATGYGIYVPSGRGEYSERSVQDKKETQKRYGYRQYKNVLTNLDFERMLSASGFTGGNIERISDRGVPDSVAFIQCVGSREKRIDALYCSGICCMTTIKQAILIKEKHPKTDVFVYYNDIRVYGRESEEFYEKARELGVIFIKGIPAEISEDKKTSDLVIVAEDMLSGRIIEKKVGLVVLAVGLRPSDGTPEIAEKIHIPHASDRFILEAHPKLKPAETNVGGVFVAGCAHFPKEISETIMQAGNAAARAIDVVGREYIEIEGIVAEVDEKKCSGCGFCVRVCPYDAIKIEGSAARVNKILCKSCGSCSSVCPSGAIQQKHFKDNQLSAQIKALLE